jgi:hypothetical protein
VRIEKPSGQNLTAPVTAAQSRTKRRMPQGDAELMTEKQVLGFKPAPLFRWGA